VAALAVAAFHLFRFPFPPFEFWSTQVFYLGEFGYYLFFLISGCAIRLSMESGLSAGVFLWRRAVRILPLYWTVLGLSLGLAALGVLHLEPAFGREPIGNALWNLTTLQQIFDRPSALAPFWTLGYETVFYALAAVALAVGWLPERSIAIPWAAAALAIMLLGPASAPGRLYFLAFGVGMLAAETLRGRYHGAWTLGAAAVLVVLHALALPGHNLEHISAESTFRAVVLAIVFFLLSASHSQAKWPEPLLALGRISFSLYLTHAVLTAAAYKIHSREAYAVAIVLALPVAFLTYRWVEKPYLQASKMLGGR
jgi:peptidoglycan/LPS O-acetylase OafA/YrhL